MGEERLTFVSSDRTILDYVDTHIGLTPEKRLFFYICLIILILKALPFPTVVFLLATA